MIKSPGWNTVVEIKKSLIADDHSTFNVYNKMLSVDIFKRESYNFCLNFSDTAEPVFTHNFLLVPSAFTTGI